MKKNQTIKGNNNNQNYIQNQNITIITSETTQKNINENSIKNVNITDITYKDFSNDGTNLKKNNFNKLKEDSSNNINNYTFIDRNNKILNELILKRCVKEKNTYYETAVKGAIDIINQLTDSSLSALTIMFCLKNGIHFKAKTLNEYLDNLSKLYSSIIISKLPEDDEWMDQLDILKAIRLHDTYKEKKFKELFNEWLSNFACAGIKKDSKEYKKALKIQKKLKMNVLIKNELIDEEYYVVQTCSKYEISNYGILIDDKMVLLNEEKVNCIYKIMDLYTKDVDINQKIFNNLMNVIDKYPYIKIVQSWWDSLVSSCDLTKIGKVLGHANLEKCFKDIPIID